MCAEAQAGLSGARSCMSPGNPFLCPGSRRPGAAHMGGMNRDDYTPTVLEALDSDPDARLAISLYNLSYADEALLIGLDLVKSYARTTEPAALAGDQAVDVARFRRALDILDGYVLLDGKTWSWPASSRTATRNRPAAASPNLPT